MKLMALATLAVLAAPVVAFAQDPAAALIGHRLMISRSNMPEPITVALQPGGVAQKIGAKGRTVGGTWMVQGDKVCMTFAPRPQKCLGSLQELLATGRTAKTTPSGQQVSVVLQ
jgi:hypothetical protein